MSQESTEQKNRAVDQSAGSERAQHSSLRQKTLLEMVLRFGSALWPYKWLIVLITFFVAAGSVAFAIVSVRLPPLESPMPDWYEADAILFQQRAGSGQGVSQTIMASLGMEAEGGTVDFGQLAIQILNSRSFIDRIIEKNNIIARNNITDYARTRSRRVVLSNASFDFDVSTGMLRISYRSIDPEFAAEMVSSIVEELLLWFASRGGSDRLLAVQTMGEKLAEVDDRIAEIEGEIERFQRRYGVLQVEEIAQAQTGLLSSLQSQLLTLDLQISNQRNLSRIDDDPELLLLRSQRQSVLNLMERIREGYTGSNELLPPRDELPGLSAEYSRLQMDLSIQSRIFQSLTEQYEVAKLVADTDPAFTILVPVEVPEEKSGPMRGAMVASNTLLALAGIIVLALVIRWMRSVFADPAKRRLLRGPVLE